MHPTTPQERRRLRDAARQCPHRRRVSERRLLRDDFARAGCPNRGFHGQALLLLFAGARPTAPMAGARVSHRPMVTTNAVMYPNGRIPTSSPTMPAKIIKSQALTKNSGPAAISLKNASTINHLRAVGRRYIWSNLEISAPCLKHPCAAPRSVEAYFLAFRAERPYTAETVGLHVIRVTPSGER